MFSRFGKMYASGGKGNIDVDDFTGRKEVYDDDKGKWVDVSANA
jgi:hypothetical protein